MHEALDSFNGTSRAYAAKAAELLDEIEESDDVDAASKAVIALCEVWSGDEQKLQLALEVVIEAVALGYGCCLTDRGIVTRLAAFASARGASPTRKSAFLCLASLTKCACTNHTDVVFRSLSPMTLDSLVSCFPKCKSTRKAAATFRANAPKPPEPGKDAEYDAKRRAAERAAAALIAEEEQQKKKKMKAAQKIALLANKKKAAALHKNVPQAHIESASESESESENEDDTDTTETRDFQVALNFENLPTCAYVLHAIDIEIHPNDFVF